MSLAAKEAMSRQFTTLKVKHDEAVEARTKIERNIEHLRPVRHRRKPSFSQIRI